MKSGALLQEKLKERWQKYGQGPEVEKIVASGRDLPIEVKETWEQVKRRAQLQDGRRPGESEEEEDVVDDLEYRELWSSGKKKDVEPKIISDPSSGLGSILADLKEQAKGALARGDVDLAEELYTHGLKVIAARIKDEKEKDEDASLRDAAAIFYSNRSYTRTKQELWLESIADAYAALELKPKWTKPYFRIAQAKAGVGDYRSAMAACRQGQEVLTEAGSRVGEFTALMDEISNSAVLDGSLAGFDGRLLHVRSAGEEAWLGKEAPLNPLIDEVAEETSLRLGLGGGDSGDSDDDGDLLDEGTKASVIAKRKNMKGMAKANTLSFRSIKDAVEEAKDGDRILLLRGIHNTGGATIFVNKRVLIRSEGTIEETTIDHRGNSPIFRVSRNAVLQNIDIDMTGFRESLFVYGGSQVRPIIEHCRFRCSGDDAINVAGQANPIFRRCEIASCKKVGLRLYEQAGGEYVGLSISNCQQQAVKLMENCQGKFYNCSFCDNEEEGVVVMDSAEGSFRGCTIEGNKGPGLDASQKGKLLLDKCRIKQNVGGVWLWDATKSVMSQCTIEGGTSHSILAQGECLPSISSSIIEGMIQATDDAWEGICKESNKFIEPLKSVELPSEEGPFQFEPIWYQRKQ
jgi:hypothetical protein